jgi:hypothetical protein
MRRMEVNHLHLMVPDVRAAAIHERMAGDGLEVWAPRRESFYVSAPGGFDVELGA